MTPHLKLIPHDPKKGQWGDCYRTCIASLLDVHPSTVPNTLGNKYLTREYLTAQGYSLVEVPVYGPTLDEVLATIGFENADAFYIVIGTSKNGVGHSIICHGHHVVHDPNPDKPGLVSGFEGDMFFVQFIVPLAMTQKAERPKLRRVAN